MSYPKRRARDFDGNAVHVDGWVEHRIPADQQPQVPGWVETVFCGRVGDRGGNRCRRHMLGTIIYPPGWVLLDAVKLLPDLDAEQLPDGSWTLGPGHWADTPERRRGPAIPLPAIVWCDRCGTRRRVHWAPARRDWGDAKGETLLHDPQIMAEVQRRQAATTEED